MRPKSVRTTSSNVYTCNFCNYSTDKSANLSRHRKTMHETVKESIVCCGLSFLSKADYREHNKLTHATGHGCPVCYRKFSRRALLRRHLSVHTGYKEFKCLHCSYASSHKSNLSRHMKVHQSKNQVTETVIKMESNNNNSQPDSTTSPVNSNESQHSQIIVRPFPILRSMLSPSLDSSEPCEPKLSHSIESILSRSYDDEKKIVKQESFSSTPTMASGCDSQISSLDEVTSTTTTSLYHPLPYCGNNYWSRINDSPFVVYPNPNTSSFLKYNNNFTGYDSSSSPILQGGVGGCLSPACYSFDFLPSIGLTNDGPGQDSRYLSTTHPYAVSSSTTTSCYQTFRPKVLVYNTSTYNNDYQLSPPGLSTDSSQFNAF